MKFSLLTTALLFATSSFSSPIAPSSPVLESEDAVASLNDTASSAYIELPVHHDLETRQSATTCGGYSYSQSRVSAAYRQGLNSFNNGQQVGTNRYPHRFNNREGFNFPVAPPYQIFPIMQSGNVYTGGEYHSFGVSG